MREAIGKALFLSLDRLVLIVRPLGVLVVLIRLLNLTNDHKSLRTRCRVSCIRTVNAFHEPQRIVLLLLKLTLPPQKVIRTVVYNHGRRRRHCSHGYTWTRVYERRLRDQSCIDRMLLRRSHMISL